LAYTALALGLLAGLSWFGLQTLGQGAGSSDSAAQKILIPELGARFQPDEVAETRSVETEPEAPTEHAVEESRESPAPALERSAIQPVRTPRRDLETATEVAETSEPTLAPVTLFSQPTTESSPPLSEPEALPQLTNTPTSSAPAVSVVELHYRHKNEKAHLSVLLDGEVVWSELLKRPINPVAWARGKDVMAIIPVPQGQHSLEVRVSVPSLELETSRSIRSHFTAGAQRVLKVTLNRKSSDLRLRWKE
jgi:hypothetical protein